jgi:hypothetical protein
VPEWLASRMARIDAIRRLDEQARRLEDNATGPQLEEHIEVELALSHEHGGRDMSGPAQPESKRQLPLFSAPEVRQRSRGMRYVPPP